MLCLRTPLPRTLTQEGGVIRGVEWLDDKPKEAKVKSTEQAYQLGLIRGQGLKGLGINLNLAPVLDIGVKGDFLMKRGRCYQGTPQEIGSLGKSAISGQKDGGIMSTAKHFPGYGGIIDDPETVRVAVEDAVPEYSQFQVAAEAQPEFVMSVVDVIYTPIDPELAFSICPDGIKLLRNSIPGDYLVISDNLATYTMNKKYGLKNTISLAVKAGADVLLVCDAPNSLQAYNFLCKAVQNGEITEAELDQHVFRIVRQKLEYFPQ